MKSAIFYKQRDCTGRENNGNTRPTCDTPPVINDLASVTGMNPAVV